MLRTLIATCCLALFAAAPAAADAGNGLIETPSPHSVTETADRLEAALTGKGLVVFARIDHAAAAAAAGEELRPTLLIIFGNPKSGTKLMQKAPAAGIDLPLKAVVYEAADGSVRLAYNSADYVMDQQLARHGLAFTDEQKAPIAAMLEAVSAEAVK